MRFDDGSGFMVLAIALGSVAVAGTGFIIADRLKGDQEHVPGVAGPHTHHPARTEIRHVKVGKTDSIQVIHHNAYDETPITHRYGKEWIRGVIPPGSRYNIVITTGHWTGWHYTSSLSPANQLEQR